MRARASNTGSSLPAPVPHVDHDDARLAADHSRHPHVAGQADQLVHGNVGRPVVGDRQLQADDLVDERDVLFDASRDGEGGHAVSSAERVGCDSFLSQRLGLGYQILHTAGHVVSAQQTQHRGDSRPDQGRKADFRRPGMEAPLPAAPDQVYVLVDQARA